MTTQITMPRASELPDDFVFPDPPENPEDKMTTFDHLTITGGAHYLAEHLAEHVGNRETTLVAGDRYMSPIVTADMTGLRYPDMIVAFGVDPEAYRARNAYVVRDQGKPPDFVMEIASKNTGTVDVKDKPADYAALGISEYWRFDETGEYHGAALGGDILVNSEYVPIQITELDNGSLQGYSPVLDIYIRWEHHQLKFYDPATNEPIASLDTERARANAERRARIVAEAQTTEEMLARMEAESRAENEQKARLNERKARMAAESRAENERKARVAAEARLRELEERHRQQDL